MKKKLLVLTYRLIISLVLVCVSNIKAQNSKVYYNQKNALQLLSSNATILANYDFDNVQDNSGTYIGSLQNGAQLKTEGGFSILDLGTSNGYFDFGSGFGAVISQLDDFSISTNMMISSDYNITGNGNFVWTFANSTNMATLANGNMFFGAKRSRYTISKTHYAEESSVIVNDILPKGRWINVTYTQLSGEGKVYINGNLIATSNVVVNPSELGVTAYNFLGRSCYIGDKYLEATQFDKFTIYNGALSASDVSLLYQAVVPLNTMLDRALLDDVKQALEIPNAGSINADINLPVMLGEEVQVSWASSAPDVITTGGLITRPSVGEAPVVVTLTATLRLNDAIDTKQFEVTVLPQYTDAESVQLDLDRLEIQGNTNNIRTSIVLPITTTEGSRVVWSSNAPEYLNHTGQVVQLAAVGTGKKAVTLTAIAVKGEEKSSRTFEVWVAEDEDKSAYLFSYFTGNNTNGEQIRFAVSNDGYDYIPLNNGQRIMDSDTISIKNGVRDPHILRAEDGDTFYMVVTDMKSSEGWSSNRGIVLLKSNDLVNWTHATVHFPAKFPDTWSNVLRVWAPQTIYDPVEEKYMVYFSLYTGDTTAPYDRIYYCYTNDDFTDLIGTPQLLFDRGTASIDGDIVFNEADGLYHMFFKNESLGGISKVTSSTLAAPLGHEPGSQWSEPSLPLQQTNKAVEGSGVFRLINTDDWVLMYDCYANGHYQYCRSSDLTEFNFVKDNYDINARHGTTVAISKSEAQRLVQKWPSTALLPQLEGSRNEASKRCDINENSKTVTIGVKHGVDLTNFNPQLYASPGAIITPVGSQDFSAGAVNYQVIQNGVTSTYTVSITIEANPILPQFHADPDILYAEKTGRFYIYPTTDGFPEWGSTTFDVFSSPDLVHWTNEGTILNLSSHQVSWASGNAWAPTIIEKKTGDSYKYYYYFSGDASGTKNIGVAVANDPLGPFIDSGAPLISEKPTGVSGGQEIDPNVFIDPISQKSYLYWGNGYLAVAELNEDMVSLKTNTIQVITPSGGTLSTYAYREGVHVFYRDGLYYFLWSVDDTGSTNYHVAYGTATSPTGPISVASEPVVIAQNAVSEIYGTGHHAVLQIPGEDTWYIVYHRIHKAYLSDDPGVHREVCVEPLHFNGDGTIVEVTPTHRGIDPVILNHVSEALSTEDKLINTPHFKLLKQDVYNVLGQFIGNTTIGLKSGIYIIRNTYENGSISVKKQFIYP